MKTQELKVSRIGNSRGVRLPAATLRRYRIGGTVLMQEKAEGIMLRPVTVPDGKLSWEDTARAMAARAEDWSEWDATAADGLESVPWRARPAAVAERNAAYRTKRARRPGPAKGRNGPGP